MPGSWKMGWGCSRARDSSFIVNDMQLLASRWQFLVCEGPTCGGCKFSAVITQALRQEVQRRELGHRVGVVDALCLGRCRDGPNVLARRVGPQESLNHLPGMEELESGTWIYGQVTPESLPAILQSHVGEDRPLSPFAEEY